MKVSLPISWIMNKRRIIDQWSLVFDNWTILHCIMHWAMNTSCSPRITNFVFIPRHVSISMRRRTNGNPMGWKLDRRQTIFKHSVFLHTFNHILTSMVSSLSSAYRWNFEQNKTLVFSLDCLPWLCIALHCCPFIFFVYSNKNESGKLTSKPW